MSDPAHDVELEDDRPATVTAASLLTMFVSVITFFLGIIAIYGMLSDKAGFLDRLANESDLGETRAEDVYYGLIALAVVLMLWCVVAVVLAVFALRRSSVARVLLVVSAVVTALLSLPGVLFVYPIMTLVCGAAVAVMLNAKVTKQWYARS